MFHLTDQENGC